MITYYSDGSFFAANIWYFLFGWHCYIKASPILHESPGRSIQVGNGGISLGTTAM